MSWLRQSPQALLICASCLLHASLTAAQALPTASDAQVAPENSAPDAGVAPLAAPANTTVEAQGDAALPSTATDAPAPAAPTTTPNASEPATTTGSDDGTQPSEENEADLNRPKGTVRGVVVSAELEEPIADAYVYARGLPIDTRTDAEGRFELQLPEGTRQIAVIQPGYATQTVRGVKVKASQQSEVTVKLTSSTTTFDEYLVTAGHIEGGIASLIAERRKATAVADVIGSEQMSRAGASNAAAALSRVTGLTIVDGKFVVVRGMGERYSSLLVNGLLVPSPEPTRRVVPLDLFPAGVLESIVVQKTFSPDAQGEFGGGVVQLRTRSYPNKFMANLSIAGGYNHRATFLRNNTYEGGNADFLGVDDGARALPSSVDHAGKLVPKSFLNENGYDPEQINEYGRSLSNNWQLKKERTLPDLTLFGAVGNRFDLRHARIGFVAALGYRTQTTAFTDAKLRVAQLQTDTDGRVLDQTAEQRTYKNFTVDQTQRQISTTGFLDWGVEFSPQHKLKFTTMLLRQTDDWATVREGTERELQDKVRRRVRLDWIERQLIDQQVAGHHVFKAAHDFGLSWRYSFARADRDQPDRRDYGFMRDDVVGAPYLLEQQPGDITRWFATLREDSHQASLDLTQPFNVWSRLEAKAKAGAFVFSKKRDSETRIFEYIPGPDANLNISSPQAIASSSAIGDTVRFEETTRSNDAYKAEMLLAAGYGMIELPIVKSVDLMGGARVENAHIQVESYDPLTSAGEKSVAKLDNTDVLPALTVTWRIIEALQLRGGYGRTLNRPDLRELATQPYYDIEIAATTEGAPELKRALIDSVDMRLEYYLTTDEVFSVGGFYKNFQDPIETFVKPSASSEPLYSFLNSKGATLIGLELEGRKRFGFLHPKLNPGFIAGNFSWIDSSVELGADAGSRNRPLQSQSPWVLNLQLGYDDDVEGGSGMATSVLYNVSGKRLRAVGQPEQGLPDQYELPYHSLDFVFSQRLKHGFTLGFRGQNLLNATQRWKASNVTVREFKRGVYLTATLGWSY